MAKKKITPMNIFNIILEGFYIYIRNFIPLTQAMLFPIFGQVFGILLIYGVTYFYTTNYTTLFKISPFFNNPFILFSILLILVIPGFFLFTKAFWHMMLVMVSLNPMVYDMHQEGKFYQSEIYEQNVRLRTKDYVWLLLLLAGIWFGALIFPLFFLGLGKIGALLFIATEAILLFCASILSIYLCLCYQIFGFELNLSPMDTLKKSFNLVQGNFIRTVFLSVILFLTTGMLIPYLAKFFSSELMLTQLVARPVEAYFELMFANIDAVELLKKIPDVDTIYELALMSSEAIISMIATGLVLPLGSAWYTLLYKDIKNKRELAAIAKEKKSQKKTKAKK